MIITFIVRVSSDISQVMKKFPCQTNSTSQSFQPLILHFLHLISDLGDDVVEGATELDGLNKGVQAPGVLSQEVQQHTRLLSLRAPTVDLLCIIPCQDSASAQVVEVAISNYLVTEVGPQPDQHLEEKFVLGVNILLYVNLSLKRTSVIRVQLSGYVASWLQYLYIIILCLLLAMNH